MVRSPLSLFNGPRIGGNATVIAHARQLLPTPQTYVIVITIERLTKGPFSYRASAELPAFAEGTGALIHLEAEVNRRYKAGGVKRSYVSARCSDSIFETRGRFEFARPRSDGDRRQRLQGLPGRSLRREPFLYLPIPGPLAQLVEQETLNLKVVGSIPTRPIEVLPNTVDSAA